MYYRNANCAVVVYDITQAVRDPIVICSALANSAIVVTRQGEGLGKGAATTSE